MALTAALLSTRVIPVRSSVEDRLTEDGHVHGRHEGAEPAIVALDDQVTLKDQQLRSARGEGDAMRALDQVRHHIVRALSQQIVPIRAVRIFARK